MDEYLKTINHTAQQLRDELRPVAEKTIKQILVLTEVARAEKIEVNETDLKSEVENMTKNMTDENKGKMVELLTLPQSQVNIASAIATRKTIDKLTEFVQPVAGNKENNEVVQKESETTQKEATT
jgi:trigger factor